MKLINIGFGSLVSARRLVAVVSPESAPIKRMVQEARERDYRDSHREIAPLRQAEDAALLDTTELDEQESEAALLRLIRERVGQ